MLAGCCYETRDTFFSFNFFALLLPVGCVLISSSRHRHSPPAVLSTPRQNDAHPDSWLSLLKGMQTCLKGKKFTQVPRQLQFVL